MKRVLFVLIAGVLFASCSQQPKEKNDKEEFLSLTIQEILINPMDYEGKIIEFEGIIDHVCRHSADKMRVKPIDDADFSLLVMLGEFTGKFDRSFEGEFVTCRGALKVELRNLYALTEGEHEHEPGDHSCETTEQAIKKMTEMGIDPEIRAFVELKSFEIK